LEEALEYYSLVFNILCAKLSDAVWVK